MRAVGGILIGLGLAVCALLFGIPFPNRGADGLLVLAAFVILCGVIIFSAGAIIAEIRRSGR